MFRPAILLATLLGFSGYSIQAETYSSPNFEAASQLVGESGIAAEHDAVRKELLYSVLQIAYSGKSEMLLKRRALAVAWALADQHEMETVAFEDIHNRFGYEDNRAELYAKFRQDVLDAEFKDSTIPMAKHLFGLDANAHRVIAGLSEDLGFAFLEREPVAPIMERAELDAHWEKLDSKLGTSSGGSGMIDFTKAFEKDSEFGSMQSSLHGLLVMEIAGGEVAGGASKMNATVSGDGSPVAGSPFRFNQQVGPMMKGALKEVEKFLTVRHGDLPSNNYVEISFEDRHVLKDGPSAAVACSLLLDSLITGDPLDTAFAVTGDMNADGGVQPVGGIDGKIRGATRARCTHVAIPRDNMKSLSDIYVLNGIRPFFEIQIFSIGDYEEALLLAAHPDERSSNVDEAMTKFQEVVSALKNAGTLAVLSNPKVIAKLREVVQLAPNHESAKVLLLQSSGRGPKHLSLQGSFVELDRCSSKVLQEGKGFTSDVDVIKDTVNEMRRLRNVLDPRTKPALDAFQDLLSGITEMHDKDPARGSSKFNEILSKIQRADIRLSEAYAAIQANPEIQEELNYR